MYEVKFLEYREGNTMILILGANGFIGYNLVKRFAVKKKIRIFDKVWDNEIDNTNVEVVTGDFRNVCFEEMLEEVDTVFHFISSSVPFDGTDKIIDDVQANLLPTLRLLDAMKKRMVRKIIFISSGGTVYGECKKPALERDRLSPECIYAAQKVGIEICLHLYEKYDGIQGYILRVGNPYGFTINKKRNQGIIPIFTEKIVAGETIELWGNGENKRDYIYIGEVIDAIEAVYLYNGKYRIFNIGTGKNCSTKEIIKKIEKEVGKKAKINYLERRKFDLAESCMYVSLIYKEFVLKSKITVDQGIRQYIREIMSNDTDT